MKFKLQRRVGPKTTNQPTMIQLTTKQANNAKCKKTFNERRLYPKSLFHVFMSTLVNSLSLLHWLTNKMSRCDENINKRLQYFEHFRSNSFRDGIFCFRLWKKIANELLYRCGALDRFRPRMYYILKRILNERSSIKQSYEVNFCFLKLKVLPQNCRTKLHRKYNSLRINDITLYHNLVLELKTFNLLPISLYNI